MIGWLARRGLSDLSRVYALEEQSTLEQIGKLMVFAGLGLAVLGGLVWVLSPWLRLGRLPGDIAVEREDFRLYAPIATMLLLSLVLSGVMALVRWWQKR